MINAIVFDMDGVLCRYRIERRLDRLASWSGQRPDAIHAAIWRSGFEDEAERGLMSANDYLRGFGERMGYPLSAAQWVEARRAAIEPDLAVLSLARQLGTHLPVGMFTNNPLLLKRHLAEVFPAVPDIFATRAVFSAELGRSKPDPEAFRRLAARLGLAPGRSCISTTMRPMSRAPGRPGSSPIQSARRQTCAPASRLTGSIAGRVISRAENGSSPRRSRRCH